MIYAVAILAPLFGSVIAGALGRTMGDRFASMVTICLMLLASVCAELSLMDVLSADVQPEPVVLATWFDIGGFRLDWALRRDTLSSVMVAMVAPVATLIHIYSIGYMAHEKRSFRFFAYLSLFSFAMLMLVTANNLVQLFFGWEGVGLASYLLIGYWYDRPSANRAAMKAFIVNRVGDLFFAVGIALVFALFGTVEFPAIFAAVPQHTNALYHVLGDQLPGLRGDRRAAVHRRDGQVGADRPTHLAAGRDGGPNAGLGADPCRDHGHRRCLPGCPHVPSVRDGAPCGRVRDLHRQHDLPVRRDHRVRADGHQAGDRLFDLLAAGLHVHGGRRGRLPGVDLPPHHPRLLQGVAVPVRRRGHPRHERRAGHAPHGRYLAQDPHHLWLHVAGQPGYRRHPVLRGYWSKDAILEAAYSAHTGVGTYGFVCGTAAAFLTAFYSWRLLIMTFHGAPRADRHTMEHVHESPWTMLGPLCVLAVGAVFAGWALHVPFIGDEQLEFWAGSIANGPNNHVLLDMEHVPFLIGLLPTITGVLGIGLAYMLYMAFPAVPPRLAAQFNPVYQFLLHKWYFDELYDFLFVRPSEWLARKLWHVGDETLIDGMPNGVAMLAAGGSAQIVRIQTGSIAVYAFTMLIGLVLLITVFLLFR